MPTSPCLEKLGFYAAKSLVHRLPLVDPTLLKLYTPEKSLKATDKHAIIALSVLQFIASKAAIGFKRSRFSREPSAKLANRREIPIFKAQGTRLTQSLFLHKTAAPMASPPVGCLSREHLTCIDLSTKLPLPINPEGGPHARKTAVEDICKVAMGLLPRTHQFLC